MDPTASGGSCCLRQDLEGTFNSPLAQVRSTPQLVNTAQPTLYPSCSETPVLVGPFSMFRVHSWVTLISWGQYQDLLSHNQIGWQVSCLGPKPDSFFLFSIIVPNWTSGPQCLLRNEG